MRGRHASAERLRRCSLRLQAAPRGPRRRSWDALVSAVASADLQRKLAFEHSDTRHPGGRSGNARGDERLRE